MTDSTLTTHVASARPPGAAALFVVLTAQQPWQPSSRHLLTGMTQVEVRRGARAVDRSRNLVLALPDQRLSSFHARLRLQDERWYVEDMGSKNGVLRNGTAIAMRAPLDDGDVIEMGRSFFAFRTAPTVAPDEPIDLMADAAAAPGGLASLGLTLGRRFADLARAAMSQIPVVLYGETGTGKELAARAVHTQSGRPGSMTAVNCGALPRSLLESELFGFKKGSFSGALQDRLGLIAASHKGTLFLDEVAELPLDGQAALLRVLQEREVMPIGARHAQPLDLRVVSATHRNLEVAVASGAFRADLYGRLRGFELTLPALRDRREDLGMIVQALLAQVAPGAGRMLSHAAARALFARRWAGNVRELEHALQLAAVMAPEAVLEFPSEPGAEGPLPVPGALPWAANSDRRAQLGRLLREHRGNVTRVARTLGKAREQVHRWITREGLDPADFRSTG